MSKHRRGAGVGVLDGVLYAVGGMGDCYAFRKFNCLSSVEAYRPSTGAWTPIANMHYSRHRAGSCL